MICLFDFLAQIIDVIKLLIDFFIHLVQSIYDLITIIPRALVFVTSATLYVPSIFVAYILAGISLSVILVIVGRN